MSELLFDPSIIPDEVRELVGPEFEVRPLAVDDYKRGHLDLLSGLTQAPDTGEPGYTERFKLMKSFPGTYYIIVFTPKDNPDKVVASGTLLVERKFIRNLASSGHIEDIVVDKAIQGKGLGKKLLQSLIILSRAVGNYKTLLDCSDENRGFYEKCGFTRKGNEMGMYM